MPGRCSRKLKPPKTQEKKCVVNTRDPRIPTEMCVDTGGSGRKSCFAFWHPEEEFWTAFCRESRVRGLSADGGGAGLSRAIRTRAKIPIARLRLFGARLGRRSLRHWQRPEISRSTATAAR